MLSYGKFFILFEEAGPNKHLTHLEELVLVDKKNGAERAINYLSSLAEILDSDTTRAVSTNIKFDGCIHPDTQLITLSGNMSIKDIIDCDCDIKVKAHNFNLKEDVWVTAQNPRINSNEKNWVEIVLDNGETFKCTEDHKIFTLNRGWVEAKSLNKSDDLKYI